MTKGPIYNTRILGYDVLHCVKRGCYDIYYFFGSFNPFNCIALCLHGNFDFTEDGYSQWEEGEKEKG